MALDYTREDFDTSAPYEMIVSIQDPFEREVAINRMSVHAQTVGINATGFKRMLKMYTETQEQLRRTIYVDNTTSFTKQPLELDTGEWRADDGGVSRRTGMGTEVACPHPILPVERLVNIDTGVEKLKIAFCKSDRRWRELIADKKTLASNNSILQLADMGVAVTSENARALVRYISDIENLNYDKIPEKKSVSRLGHIEGEGFSPYVKGLIFDGDANFRSIFECIKTHGSGKAWLETAREARKGNIMARVVLAAAFASVLIKPSGALPFFVHLWGGESGTGKTVALMLAASVWGCPEMGRYIQTFNSTVVGREKLASFLNHLPLMVDELQLAKDSRGKIAFDVYALAEGVGRTRGTKTGGIDRTPTWHNCILTTGETPITGTGSGAGAVNRVIEIECKSSERIVEDGHTVSGAVRKNYGFAGKKFVKELYDNPDNLPRIAELYRTYFKELSDNDTTEKQAMAAAVILIADKLATEWIFKDGSPLTVAEISKFLASKASVSSGERGYQYMCGWVSQNSNRFHKDATDVYGVIESKYGDAEDEIFAYINQTIFRKASEDAGFSSNALISFLKERNLILTRGKNNTRGKRINGVLTYCIAMKMPSDEDESEAGTEGTVDENGFVEIDPDGDIPFI